MSAVPFRLIALLFFIAREFRCGKVALEKVYVLSEQKVGFLPLCFLDLVDALNEVSKFVEDLGVAWVQPNQKLQFQQLGLLPNQSRHPRGSQPLLHLVLLFPNLFQFRRQIHVSFVCVLSLEQVFAIFVLKVNKAVLELVTLLETSRDGKHILVLFPVELRKFHLVESNFLLPLPQRKQGQAHIHHE